MHYVICFLFNKFFVFIFEEHWNLNKKENDNDEKEQGKRIPYTSMHKERQARQTEEQRQEPMDATVKDVPRRHHCRRKGKTSERDAP